MKPTVKVTYEVITEEQFPNGVLCMSCKRVLLPGQPYTSVMDAMDGDVAIEQIVCVYC